jgi:hypothetical protein
MKNKNFTNLKVLMSPENANLAGMLLSKTVAAVAATVAAAMAAAVAVLSAKCMMLFAPVAAYKLRCLSCRQALNLFTAANASKAPALNGKAEITNLLVMGLCSITSFFK